MHIRNYSEATIELMGTNDVETNASAQLRVRVPWVKTGWYTY